MKTSVELLGDWKITKTKLKQKYKILNSKDLLLDEGKEDLMIKRLQTRLLKTPEEMYKILDQL